MKTKMMKYLAAIAVAITFTLPTLADVEPTVMWNGDFTNLTQGDYTLTLGDGNAVSADGSYITIGQTATTGVKVSGGDIYTILVKASGYTPTSSSNPEVVVAMLYTDTICYMGIGAKADGYEYDIWNNGAWGNDHKFADKFTDTNSHVYSLSYTYSTADSIPQGTSMYLDGASIDIQTGLRGQSLAHATSAVIGGPISSTALSVAKGLKIEAIAIFAGTDVAPKDAAAYVFPKTGDYATPKYLLNLYDNQATADNLPEGWVNYTYANSDGKYPCIPESGDTIEMNGISFVTTSAGNFFNNNHTKPSQDFSTGTYTDIFGESHTSLLEEISASAGLDITLNEDIYKTGFMNGGYNNHTATISGLDKSKKYVVYYGIGLYKTDGGNQTSGFTIQTSGYGSVEKLEYVSTVAYGSTAVATSYTEFSAGTALQAGVNGLLLIRATDIVPTDEGEIKYTMSGTKAGLNFIIVSEVTREDKSFVINAEGTIKTSEINTQAGDETEVQVIWTGDNPKLEFDDELTCTSLRLVCDGDLTLSGTKPDADEYAKLNIGSVTGAVVRDWVTMVSIGVNFTSGQGKDTTSAVVAGSTWYNVANATGSNTEVFGDGFSTVTWSSANTWNYTHASGSILNGYLDDGGSHAQVTVTGIPWATYDVLIYCATDQASRKFSPVTINGALYTCDSDGIAKVASAETETWGQCRNATAVLGTNVIRLNEVTASTLRIVGGANANSARGGIAAIQIVKKIGEKDINSDDNITISAINKQISKDYTVNLTIAAGKTITFDEAPIFAVLNVTTTGGLTVTEDDYTVTSDDVGKVVFSGVTLLTIDNTEAFMNGTPSCPVKVVKTGGFSTFPYKTTSLAVDLTIVSPVNEEEVGNLVGNKKNVIFEEGFSMNTARWNLGNQGSVTQKYTQNAGAITITKTTTGNDTSNPLVLGHWGSTVNYALNGGSIEVPNGRVMFGWDGNIYMTVGGGSSAAEFKVLGLNSDRSNTASLDIKSNGTLKIGSEGVALAAAKSVTLSGGTFESYETASVDIQHANGLSVTGESTIKADTNTTLTFTNAVNVGANATLTVEGDVVFYGGLSFGDGAWFAISGDEFNYGTLRPGFKTIPTLMKLTFTDAEYAAGTITLNLGSSITSLTKEQLKIYLPDGTTEATWAETNPITLADGVATLKFQTTQPITEAANVSDIDENAQGVVIVQGAAEAADAFTVTFDAALPEGVTELRVTGHAKLTVGGDITTLPAAKIALGDNANVTIDRPFDTDFTIPEGTVLNLVGGDDLAGRKDYNLFTVNGTLTTSGYCNLNNATVVNTTGELIVETGALTYKGGDQSMKGTLTVKSGTELNGCTGDMLNYSAACRVNVYGTIDLGSKRWSCADDTKIFLYNGGLIKGTGDGYGMLDYFENNGRLVASGTCEIAGPIRLRHSDHTTKICTCRGTVLTISGVIKESGSLEKTYATVAEGNTQSNSGNAFTWLTGANTFKGNLTHVANSGSLCFASTTSFAAGTKITLGSGTALQLGDSTHTGSLTLANAIENGSRIDVYLDANLTGAISGSGAINVKNGATLVKADTLASTGKKTVEAGGALVISGGEIDWSAISFTGWTINGFVGIPGESSFNKDTTLDKNLKILSGAKLTIPEGVAVTANPAANAIVGPGVVAGAGTLIYDSAFTKPTGLQDADWTGTLWLKNMTLSNFDFGAYGREDGGKVKLTGVTGYGPSSTDAGCAAEVILEDDGETKALTIKDGYSSATYTFYKLSGSGTFCTTKDSVTAQYRFKDISGFSGTFKDLNAFRVAIGTGSASTDSGKVTFDDGANVPANEFTVPNAQFAGSVNVKCAANLIEDTKIFNCASIAALPTTYTVYSGTDNVTDDFMLYAKDDGLYALKKADPVEPGKNDPEVPADNAEEAKAKVEFEVPTAVAQKGIDETAYKALFQKKATEVETGVWKVEFELTDEAKAAEVTKLDAAVEEVAEEIEKATGEVSGQLIDKEFTGTPGLYYSLGVKRLKIKVENKDGTTSEVESAWIPTSRGMADKDGKVTLKIPYHADGELYQVGSEVQDVNADFGK